MQATVLSVLRQVAGEVHVTEQRRKLIEVVMVRGQSFSAEELVAELGREGVAVGRATVYRTLSLLTHLGYLSKVQEGERRVYAVCAPGHHHHLVCLSCGRVLHIPGCPVSGYLVELESTTGYRVAGHRLEVAGVCRDCREGGNGHQPSASDSTRECASGRAKRQTTSTSGC